MKLTLTKKHDQSDKNPLVILMKEPTFFCAEVSIKGSIEVDDEMGYAILGDRRYSGLFVQDGYEAKSATGSSYHNKSVKSALRDEAKAST
jgi:hypothetical protein